MYLKNIHVVLDILLFCLIYVHCKNIINKTELTIGNVASDVCSKDRPCTNKAECQWIQGSTRMTNWHNCVSGKPGDYCKTVPNYITCNCWFEKTFDYNEKRCRITCNKYRPCYNSGECRKIVADGEAGFCECKSGTNGELCQNINDCNTLDCRTGNARCAYDGISGAYCKCFSDKQSYDDVEKICRNKCPLKCGNDPNLICMGNLTIDADIICGCKRATMVYVNATRSCEDRCSLNCGKNPNIICRGNLETDEDTICECKNATMVYSKSTRSCEDRCSLICGHNPNVICRGTLETDADTICGCKNATMVYFTSTRSCEDRCPLICGNNPNVICRGNLETDADTTCGCKNATMVYFNATRSCEERCAAKCGHDPNIKCAGDQETFETTHCGCSESTMRYDVNTKVCKDTSYTCSEDSQCKNNAKCATIVVGGKERRFCECKSGTSGDFCEIVEKCDILDCESGYGECVYDGISGGYCYCSLQESFDYNKKRCRATCHKDKPCYNGGECLMIVADDKEKGFCECKSGTSGDLCETVNGCDTLDCGALGNVECAYDGISGGYCKCKDNHSSFDSVEKICLKTCHKDKPCYNGGLCLMIVVDDKEKGFCECKSGTSGDLCETVNDCDTIDCGALGNVECAYDGISGGYCKCKGNHFSFDSVEKICRNRCSLKCGDNPNVICRGNLESDADTICECEKKTMVYLKSTRSCEERCPLICGNNPNVICRGTLVTDADTICGCKNETMVYFKGTRSCQERCEAKCGYDPNIKCVGDQETFETTNCACTEPTMIYDVTDKVCKVTTPCNPNPCKNEGDCAVDGAKAKCICKNGYRGETCEIVPTPCNPNPCKNEGDCAVEGVKAKCTCKSGYTGETCEIAPTPCNPNPCKNEGDCAVKGGKAKCICRNGYTGEMCELDPCLPNPCKNRGHCFVDHGVANCNCKFPYSGEFCETDPCTKNPCHNGGRCNVENDAVKCTCMLPYSGDFCETSPCSPNPCKNRGHCYVDQNEANCICKSPFSGEFCETESKWMLAVVLTTVVLLSLILVCGTNIGFKINRNLKSIARNSGAYKA